MVAYLSLSTTYRAPPPKVEYDGIAVVVDEDVVSLEVAPEYP
jgi:hypothetical protein